MTKNTAATLASALEAGDALRDRRPRPVRVSWLRQSAGLSRLDRALYPTAEDYLAHRGRYQYGRRGTPTSEALAGALRELEGPECAGVALLPSGLAAISVALLSALKAGDHVLVTDSVYLPTRKFCDGVLKRFGVTTTYYDPLIGAGIAALMQPNTARGLRRIARARCRSRCRTCRRSRRPPTPAARSC